MFSVSVEKEHWPLEQVKKKKQKKKSITSKIFDDS